MVLITEESIREFSGRAFSLEDIEQIKWMRKTYKYLPESELASTICETIGWLTPSGKPRYLQCMKFLRQLAGDGEISLPESQRRVAKKTEKAMSKADERATELSAPANEITEIGGLAMEAV